MNADAPPIAADKGLMNFKMEISDVIEPLAPSSDHDLIGGNRRGIGVHRRFQRFAPA
jgi:hypothetical protein